MSRRPDHDAGSVLVEALVATAIVAMVLVGVWRVVADSAARHHGVEARRYALLIARSQLAAVGSATPLAAGSAEGREGENPWQVQMTPCGPGGSSAGVLYCVAVSVYGPDGGPPLVTLNSRRLAPLA